MKWIGIETHTDQARSSNARKSRSCRWCKLRSSMRSTRRSSARWYDGWWRAHEPLNVTSPSRIQWKTDRRIRVDGTCIERALMLPVHDIFDRDTERVLSILSVKCGHNSVGCLLFYNRKYVRLCKFVSDFVHYELGTQEDPEENRFWTITIELDRMCFNNLSGV